jgi:hypothetical protein
MVLSCTFLPAQPNRQAPLIILALCCSFGQADIRDHAEGILSALFTIIESGDSPQQIAANDNLMKCA